MNALLIYIIFIGKLDLTPIVEEFNAEYEVFYFFML